MSGSAIYTGVVTHKRLRPKRHRLSYRVFSLLLDLDELPRLSLRWLKINRWGLMSFHERDHGDGGPLRPWVDAQLARAGITAGGAVRMLCYPRMLGYVFNPLTVYFCHRPNGTLAAIIHEVHNTHGERHAYVLPASEGTVRHSCPKTFFVSPFMPMDCVYHFTITPPDETVRIGIVESDREDVLLTATFSGERTALTDAALLRAVLAHPLMTMKVTAAIHWEAVKLLLKGLRVYPHRPHRAS
ncbi:MAG TPA: DUF1365 domain-containing protein [Devosia sp.]|uniref:DUF1365 domain-containing protein n=1 Tax=Devosia sp. TaxID=1871048 RepID=UPI002F94813B